MSLTLADVWFHRYKDGKDIEGRCESEQVDGRLGYTDHF